MEETELREIVESMIQQLYEDAGKLINRAEFLELVIEELDEDEEEETGFWGIFPSGWW